jgi:hypothetical protein
MFDIAFLLGEVPISDTHIFSYTQGSSHQLPFARHTDYPKNKGYKAESDSQKFMYETRRHQGFSSITVYRF